MRIDPELAPLGSQHRPSRDERRARLAFAKRQHKKAAAHSCVLQRESVAAGVAIHISGIQHHMFHLAKGERSCPICPVCNQCAARRIQPPTLKTSERAEAIEAWVELLDLAKASNDKREGEDQL